MNIAVTERKNPDRRCSAMKANAMKIHLLGCRRNWQATIAALAVYVAAAAAPAALAQTVTCDEATLSVTAVDVKAEDLIKAVGNECGIKMVARGEVFTEDVFSVRFESMPVRTGVERILRVVNVPNHMMYFEEAGPQKRLKEIILVGQKGGERELTAGTAPEEPLDDQAMDSSEGAETEDAPDNETKPLETADTISPAEKQQTQSRGEPGKPREKNHPSGKNSAPEDIRRQFEKLMKQ
jgi:hypothetical protein